MREARIVDPRTAVGEEDLRDRNPFDGGCSYKYSSAPAGR
jgi:hypothetical protein